MITMRDFMETVNHRVTEGSDYLWQCYGHNAYRLDSWDGDQDGHSVSIVFDRETQTVYEVSVYDYKNQRAYRRINPDFLDAHNSESKERGVEADQAWDEVRYVDLESDKDFLAKAEAIVSGRDYDTRVEIPIELDDDTLFALMRMAHEQDITFNQLVENIVRAELTRIESEQFARELDAMRDELFPFIEDQEKPEKKSKKKKKK